MFVKPCMFAKQDFICVYDLILPLIYGNNGKHLTDRNRLYSALCKMFCKDYLEVN